MKPDQAHRLAAHPLRYRLLQRYARGEGSPSDVAAELGEAIGNVSYHTRILARAGAIAPTRTKQVRGAIEHYYRASKTGKELLEAFAPADARAGLSPLQASAILLALERPSTSVRNDPVLGRPFEEAIAALKVTADAADKEDTRTTTAKEANAS